MSEVSTESGSDRVSIDATVEISRTMTRSLPLSVLTSPSPIEIEKLSEL